MLLFGSFLVCWSSDRDVTQVLKTDRNIPAEWGAGTWGTRDGVTLLHGSGHFFLGPVVGQPRADICAVNWEKGGELAGASAEGPMEVFTTRSGYATRRL